MAEPALIMMFRDCPFCGMTHRSPFIDELEEKVLECRGKARPDNRGNLDTWKDIGIVLVRCGSEVGSVSQEITDGVEDASRRLLSGQGSA